MPKFYFDYVQDPYPGWLIEKAPSTYDPTSGIGVAHDIIEHFPGDSGSVEDELQALGTVLLSRYVGGYWFLYPPYTTKPEDHVSSDLQGLLEISQGDIQYPVRTMRLKDYPEVEELVDSACHQLYVESDWLSVFSTEQELRQFCKRCRGWMRKGFRRALKRYKRLHPEELAYLLHQIKENVEKLTYEAEEWTKLCVDVNFTRGYVDAYLTDPLRETRLT